MARIKIVIVTGVRLYAEGLRRALTADERFEVLAVAGGADDALHALRTGPREPDLLLADLNGADLRSVRAAAPHARVIVLGVRDHEDDVIPWAERGIDGFVTPLASLADLTDTLARAARGEAACSPSTTGALLRRIGRIERPDDGPLPHLTRREHEILTLLEEGLSNKAIAGALQIELPTVKNHVHHILEKLGSRSRAEAVARMRH
jgi:two-component system nitrate/nitrite response regulator NarL